MSLPYATLVNACNANTLPKQELSKPHYTPSKALRKAFKLLRRFFKPSSTGGMVIISAKQQITMQKTLEVIKAEKAGKAETNIHSDATAISTCSTLSAEEYENYLNELFELEASSNKPIIAE